MRRMKSLGLALVFLALGSAPLLAQDTTGGVRPRPRSSSCPSSSAGPSSPWPSSPAPSASPEAISAACEGISRNPGGAPHIRFLLVFGLVLIETLVIYALLITIIILMVQWNKYPGI